MAYETIKIEWPPMLSPRMLRRSIGEAVGLPMREAMRRTRDHFAISTPWDWWRNHYKVTDGRGSDYYAVNIVVEDIPWFWPVISGSRPHMPPIGTRQNPSRFAKDAMRHGFSPWAAARTIAARGTKPHDFIDPIWQNDTPYIEGVILQSLTDWVANTRVEAVGRYAAANEVA